jgi:ketosteroid isomerase-like protein
MLGATAEEVPKVNDEERRSTIRNLIEAQNAGDLSAFDAIYHEDLVVEWPQSGEVVHGKENLLALRRAFPTPPTATLRRITGSGDLWVIEMTFGYGEDTYHVAVIHEYRDGKVARETSYYGAPFEAPDWRSTWVEVVPQKDRAPAPSHARAGG